MVSDNNEIDDTEDFDDSDYLDEGEYEATVMTPMKSDFAFDFENQTKCLVISTNRLFG